MPTTYEVTITDELYDCKSMEEAFLHTLDRIRTGDVCIAVKDLKTGEFKLFDSETLQEIK